MLYNPHVWIYRLFFPSLKSMPIVRHINYIKCYSNDLKFYAIIFLDLCVVWIIWNPCCMTSPKKSCLIYDTVQFSLKICVYLMLYPGKCAKTPSLPSLEFVQEFMLSLSQFLDWNLFKLSSSSLSISLLLSQKISFVKVNNEASHAFP